MQQPLAFIFRPKILQEFIGQEHLIAPNRPIYNFLKTGNIPSMIFWGPPGTGKTTLALIIANKLNFDFHKISAVTDGKDTLRKIIKIATENKQTGKNTLLFIDEIHRWSKTQQDALLPYIEDGTITLIGATTENPSFTVINALLSRTQVFVFYPLKTEQIQKRLLQIIEKLQAQTKTKIIYTQETIQLIAEIADGDLRTAINILEMALNSKQAITTENLQTILNKKLRYDKKGEQHYNLISAVHKSLRSSHKLAASYYITRMLEAGEDPLYIARRLLRFASEDIGNAKIGAIMLANTVYDACKKIGMPECSIFLIQLAMYLADAPKDNSAYLMENYCKKLVKKYGNLPVPLHFRNAETKLMKNLGYGKNYKYDHNQSNKKSNQQCLPDKLHKLLENKKEPWKDPNNLPEWFKKG